MIWPAALEASFPFFMILKSMHGDNKGDPLAGTLASTAVKSLLDNDLAFGRVGRSLGAVRKVARICPSANGGS
jgi:hypothetical protein